MGSAGCISDTLDAGAPLLDVMLTDNQEGCWNRIVCETGSALSSRRALARTVTLRGREATD